MIVQLTRATDDDQPSYEHVIARVDGVRVELPAGGQVRLEPGQSATIEPRTIHQFRGEPGTGWELDATPYTVSGEVSSACDDLPDIFVLTDYADRFPTVDEDEPREVYLCHEYP